MISRPFIAAAALLAFSTSAIAQDLMPTMTWSGQFAMNTVNQMARDWAMPNSRTQASPKLTVDATSVQKLTYSPLKSRRKNNLEKFISRSREVDPVGASKMAQLFTSTDIIEAIGVQLAPYGLRTDNVADAYATWWMNAWHASRADMGDPSRAAIKAVRTQAARGLLADPKIRAASDADKQELAEALLVQAVLIDAMQDTYKDDPEMTRKVAVSVRQGAKAAGLDLDLMTLTDDGFVKAQAAGAADPAPGAEPKALAAANDVNAGPSYGFLAAAGGAGLGAAFLVGKAIGRKG